MVNIIKKSQIITMKDNHDGTITIKYREPNQAILSKFYKALSIFAGSLLGFAIGFIIIYMFSR